MQEPNVTNTDNETIIVDLHRVKDEGKPSCSFRLLQTKTYLQQHSEWSNKQQRSPYERLKQDRKDDHYYTKLEDSSFPPNMQAILDEMKQEDVTVEEVLFISRMNTPVSDDSDDETTAETDYLPAEAEKDKLWNIPDMDRGT